MSNNGDNNLIKGLLALGVIAVVVMVAVSLVQLPAGGETDASELKKFTTSDEVLNFLKSQQEENQRQRMSGGDGTFDGFMTTGNSKVQSAEATADSGSMPVPAVTGAPVSESSSADEFSGTNIQVKGVDEADFLKNDGKYIYIVTDNVLTIVDAFPAQNAEIVSKTEIKGRPSDLFVNGNRLVVFATAREEAWVHPKNSATPVPYQRQVTHAYVYDITDRSEPESVRDLRVSGNYEDARMIGDYVYLLTEDPASWHDDYVKMPEVSENGETILRPDVWCPIVPSWNYVFHTITSFNVGGDSESEPDAESFLLGYSNTLYVSQDNIYLAYPARGVYGGGGPVRIMETDADDATAGDETEDDNREKTVINRFAIDKGDITYKATGTVPGHLLNQFSLDEYKENLRVATTVDGWTDKGSYRYNNVYVLSPDLDIIGKLEFLAPDERIYSTRFMGDKLYMVTFKQIDPLFVIDLSNPREPGVLGELKIPGYSDYLHPYDENHIIGVGKETSENEWGGVSVAGVKIALFDVTDVNNPKLIDKVEIGEAGTDSEALYDHKAFLFDKTKNILVIPVREVQNVPVSGSKYSGSYSRKIWQGAYVYGLSPADGFTLKGTVRHNEDDSYYSFWGSPSAIKRSLYMDDVLYTISKELIVMSDLTDLKNRIGEIDLPKSQDNGRYYPSLSVSESVSTPVMVE